VTIKMQASLLYIEQVPNGVLKTATVYVSSLNKYIFFSMELQANLGLGLSP
jgi:hypothetical protein